MTLTPEEPRRVLSSKCRVCGEPILLGQTWIALNRYALGDGNMCGTLDGLLPGDEYAWEVDDEDGGPVSGEWLHYPICLDHWITGLFARFAVLGRSTE